MSSLGTVEHLAGTIGPRGSATAPEKDAAIWVAAQLGEMGYAPQQQSFVSGTSPYWPFIFAAGAVLISLFFFWQPQPVGAGAAFVLTGVVFIAFLLHVRLRDNPLRWLVPNDDSTNVVARAPAVTSSKPPILITAYLDSPRTTHSPSRPLLLLVLAGMAMLAALSAIGIVNNSLILRQIALIPGLLALVLFGQMVLAQRADFSAGANGNGSGVAVALDLAQPAGATTARKPRCHPGIHRLWRNSKRWP